MIMYVSTSNKGTLNMRAEPNFKSAVLKRIPYGEEIEVEVDGDWAKTSYQGVTGYVKASYLSENIGEETSKVTKEDLKKVRDSLKQTLEIIEGILK